MEDVPQIIQSSNTNELEVEQVLGWDMEPINPTEGVKIQEDSIKMMVSFSSYENLTQGNLTGIMERVIAR